MTRDDDPRPDPRSPRRRQDADLPVERRSFAEGEHHGIGLIPFQARSSIVDLETRAVPAEIGDEDAAAIRQLLHAWESVDPDELDTATRDLVTEPFVAVGPDGVDAVDQAAVAATQETEEYRELRRRFPIFRPRRVTISRLEVVFLGDVRAAVTYRVEEEFTDGQAYTGNVGGILLKTADGWRIAVISKHVRD